MTATPLDLGRPVSGDVIELILDDHRRFEALLRQLRDSGADRDAVRRAFSALHVAHAEAEEKHVYPSLHAKSGRSTTTRNSTVRSTPRETRRCSPSSSSKGTDTQAFDDAVEELSRLVNHHLAEEELTILNPARTEVSAAARKLGDAFVTERNAQIDADCGRIENVRELVARAKSDGLLDESGRRGDQRLGGADRGRDRRPPHRRAGRTRPWIRSKRGSGPIPCIFGRDSLIFALQMLDSRPEIAAATLRGLATRQGTSDDPEIDEQPGKIIHEYRPVAPGLDGRRRLAGARRRDPLLRHVGRDLVVPS